LKTGFQRPVMIHRAVLGSVERMFAIMCEQTGGKWPFWLSPRQVKVIPISEKFLGYASSIYERLKLEGYAVELDSSNYTINKKVRNAELAQFNYICVVGEEERKQGCVDLRERGNKDRLGKHTVQQFLKLLDSHRVPASKAELNLRNKAYYAPEEAAPAGASQDELDKHNEELLLQTTLEGGHEPGEKDKSLFEKLKDIEVDSKKHPHLFRWKNYIVSHLASKK